MASKKSSALSEVFDHPPFKDSGFTVDIQKSGTVVLLAGKPVTNEYMHNLSKEDSDSILNIIRMSINEERL